jgi:hypothetical protein
LFTLIFTIFVYSDIVDLLIILDKKNFLVYLLLTKWSFIIFILFFVLKKIKFIFSSSIPTVNIDSSISSEINNHSDRDSQTKEIFENIKFNHINETKKKNHNKEHLLNQVKLNSLGDNILDKYAKR